MVQVLNIVCALAHVYHRLDRSDQVARLVRRLSGFEPQVARQPERETGVSGGHLEA
jgi:hypothetical protein